MSALLLILEVALATQIGDLRSEVRRVVDAQRKNLVNTFQENSFWAFPPYLGSAFVSEHYAFWKWLQNGSPSFFPQSLINEQHLVDVLLKSQLTDGSWKQVPEENLPTGNIDATVFNYWFLKASGHPLDAPYMAKARQWVLTHGGFEGIMTMSKWKMAIFGNYLWSDLPNIPFWIFDDWFTSLFNIEKMVAQWIYPHMLPMTYVRYCEVTHELGPQYHLDELYLHLPAGLHPTVRRNPVCTANVNDLYALVKKMLGMQQPKGSFGGYTVSSLFTMFALQDYIDMRPSNPPEPLDKIQARLTRSFGYVEYLYFQTGEGSYLGVLDDGRYWDTILCAIGMSEEGVGRELAVRAGRFLETAQNLSTTGGIGYGWDFWYAPDVDDTAELVLLYAKLGAPFDMARKRAVEWILQMQNDDGGFGAFDKNRGENWLIELIAGKLADSAALFDPSSPDVTGHILEAFGLIGYRYNTSSFIHNSIQYLLKTQKSSGSWEARWGVNHVYGIGAVVPGMVRVGYPVTDSVISRALNWLMTKQNADGGWGESTLSYVNPAYVGVGLSTPSQTAWAVTALLEGWHERSTRALYEQSLQRGLQYLISSFDAHHAHFVDDSSVGTGHPKLLYMQYPAYAESFTLIALERYLEFYANMAN